MGAIGRAKRLDAARGEGGRDRVDTALKRGAVRATDTGTGSVRWPGPHCAASDGATSARLSIYDEVTAKIIGELEAGRLPWVQPWSSGAAQGLGTGTGATSPGLPHNALTGRAYSGINVLILWCALLDGGHASQGWLTFRQALQAGGAVRKGERGVTVVYADRFVPKGAGEHGGSEKAGAPAMPRGSGSAGSEGSGASAGSGDGDSRFIPFLKRFTVFNIAQCEGLKPGFCPEREPLSEREIVPVAERLIAASGVDFRVGGSKAFYAPEPDFVAVPPQPAFYDPINYYRTCLHELAHATGHPSRLARTLITAFGTKDYAREELVAEMGSAFLCAALGIVPTVRHADYIGAWLDVLREDNKAIFRAASQASKAADWLLARLDDAPDPKLPPP